MSNVYIYLIIYIVLLLAISWIISRKQKKEDFFIAGRNRGGWQILASKFAAGIGAGYFITYTGFAYEYGLGVFALLLGIATGYLLFAYWASSKIHAGSKEKKFYTIGDFVYDKTKSIFAKNFANIVSMAILFAWLMTGIIGGGKIVNDFGFLSYNIAVILTAAVVLVYILLAGFRAVIATDIIQSFIIVILLVLITVGIVGSESLGDVISSRGIKLDIGVAIGFFLFGILSVFSYSDRYQLSYAAANERKLKHGMGLAIIPIIFAGFMLLLVGNFMAAKIPGLDPGLIFTEALKNFLRPELLPLAVVLFFAGVMSSADTNVYSISSHYAMSAKKWSIKTIRNATVVLMVITALLAIAFPDVIGVSIFAGAISLTLSFPMIYLLFGGRKSSKFIFSGALSILGVIIGIAIVGLEPVAALFPVIGGILGLLLNFNIGKSKLALSN